MGPCITRPSYLYKGRYFFTAHVKTVSMRNCRGLLFVLFSFIYTSVNAQQQQTDLLVIGGGASGTMAGIQAARMGVRTLIIEETGWLGGMLTAAGVSAIDGNHRLPSGLWGEFRSHLYKY